METGVVEQSIARKPVSRSTTFGSVRRKPVPRTSISRSPPRLPVTLKFVLGPFGLHSWYNSSAVEARRPAPVDGQEDEEGKEESIPRHWSGVNDAKRFIVSENPLETARTLQFYSCSPKLVTTYVYTESDGTQQSKVIPPYQGLIAKFGKLKRDYERSIAAEQDISSWLTVCLVNNIHAQDLQIAFGPDECFYAWAPENRVARRGLPIDLQHAIDCHEAAPSDVSMGIDGNWWIRWPDGTHDQYIQQNSYKDLCLLLENVQVPQLRRIMLNPAKANEFVVEYANGHFFIRARCLQEDLRRLNEYLREQKSDIKIVVLAVTGHVLKEDVVYEPFVMPTDDFDTSPIALGKEMRPGQLPEWMETAKSGIELAKTVTEIAQAAGACSVM